MKITHTHAQTLEDVDIPSVFDRYPWRCDDVIIVLTHAVAQRCYLVSKIELEIK